MIAPLPSRFPSELADLVVVRATTLSDLSGQQRGVEGRLVPRQARDVVRIVRAAVRHGSKLHPVSCGRNWGFGSELPATPGTWIVDLSQLNQVRSLDCETGTIHIGPGVTQIDLYRHLRDQGSEWYFNVTGAGQSASVLGNALERGVGYYGQRHLDLIELQVVTGEGEIINSRLMGAAHAPALGTDLTQIFAQGCFGIVVSAKIRLIRRLDGDGAVIARLKDGFRLKEFLQAVISLKQSGCIGGVPHIANKARIMVTMAPWIPGELLSSVTAAAHPWTAALPITGSRCMTEAAFAEIRRQLEPFGDVETILANPAVPDTQDTLPPGEQLKQLASGYPSNLAIPGVEWAAFARADVTRSDPSASGAGLIHVTPAVAASTKAISHALKTIKRAGNLHGFDDLPVTVNLVDSQTAVMVISLGFPKDKAASFKARARRFEKELRQSGMLPYRIGLGQEAWLPRCGANANVLFRRLKRTFDPSGVFVPSKYDRAFGQDIPETPSMRRPHLETLLEVA